MDLIERQAAIDQLHQSYNLLDAEQRLEGLSSVQPERPTGQWLPDNNYAYETRFVCSVCGNSEAVPTIGFTKYKPIWDFCPNCGADMRGEQDE